MYPVFQDRYSGENMKEKILLAILLCGQLLYTVPIAMAETSVSTPSSSYEGQMVAQEDVSETSSTDTGSSTSEEELPLSSEATSTDQSTTTSLSSESSSDDGKEKEAPTQPGLTEPTSSSSTSSIITEPTPPSSTAILDSRAVETKREHSQTSSSSIAIYRLYHPSRNIHLYTRNMEEYTGLPARGWRQEGVAWNAALDKGEMVYRLFHPQLGYHFYTKNVSEYALLAQRGWSQEGRAFYSYGDVPIYRLYHAGMNKYLYTRNSSEYNGLVHRGWVKEGIAFYSLSSTNTAQVPPSSSTSSSSSSSSTSTTSSSSSTSPSSSSVQEPKKSVMLAWSHSLSDDIAWTADRAKENPFNNGHRSINGTIFSDKDAIAAIHPTGHYRIQSIRLVVHAKVDGQWQNNIKDYSAQAPKDGTMTWAFLEKLAKELPYEVFYFDWKVIWEAGSETSPTTVTKTQKRVTLPYKTSRQADANLWEDEERVTRQGVDGYQIIEVTTTKDNQTGRVTTSERVLETKPAVDKVISYGTKPLKTTRSVSIEEVVNFTTRTINDENLEQGKTEIRQVGINGKKVIRVTTTIDNKTGEKTERREVIGQTPAQEEIIAVGTKKPVTTPDPSKKTATLDEFIAMSEAEQDAFIAGGGSIPMNGRQFLTQEELDKSETVINVTKLNQELARLINEERAKLGRSAVAYAGKTSTLQATVDIRSNEMALHGSLRYQDKVEGAHKRPDGSAWTTAASAEHAAKVIWQGENSLQLGRAIDGFRASNEAKLAQTLFRNWMDSSGHRRLMMRDGDYYMAVSVAMGSKTYGASQDDAGVTIAILQMAKLRP